MYIIFDKNGNEQLRYYLEELPRELEDKKYVKIQQSDIPYKDGYSERATLVDDELVWEYEPIKELSKEDLQANINILSDALNEILEII